ncbi:MAG: protein kinase, partial [Eubacterium sp.]|nr:protein kinase [Eubacterium sp.]
MRENCAAVRIGKGLIMNGKYEGNERYRFIKEIGRGGTSVVYLAEDRHLGKEWAVKRIFKETADSEKGWKGSCFRAEIEWMRRLEHPSLPRIVDVFEDDEAVCIVMDYVRGERLDLLQKRIGTVSEPVARDWMCQLAKVLSWMHSQDPPVIFRDMKPSNVIRRPDGSLTLIDFGITREYKSAQSFDTVHLGTPGFAPPEQHGGGQTDARSDIYALGMTITCLLTGIQPDEDPCLYRSHPFQTIRPDLSEDFGDILNKCTAFSPEDRYSDGGELLRALCSKKRLIRKPVFRRDRKRIFRMNEEPALQKNGKPVLRKNEKPVLQKNEKPVFRKNGKPVFRMIRPVLFAAAVVEAGMILLTGVGSADGAEKMMQETGREERVLSGSEDSEDKEMSGTAAGSAVQEEEETEADPDMQRKEGTGADPAVQRKEGTEADLAVQMKERTSAEETVITGILEKVKNTGRLDNDESEQFLKAWNKYTDKDPEINDTYTERCFQAGKMYFFNYSGEEGSFRERILYAQPFFEEALNAAEETECGAGQSGNEAEEENRNTGQSGNTAEENRNTGQSGNTAEENQKTGQNGNEAEEENRNTGQSGNTAEEN